MAVILIPLVWFLDQWTKKYADENFRNEARKYFVNEKVSLAYVENHGAFLGFLRDKPKLLHALTIASIIMITVLAIPYWFMGKGKVSGIALAIMLGGAIGNYTDRVKKAYVTDFVAFAPKHKVHFNVADFAIFAGALVVILDELL